jgi:hypothetical protein
MRALRAKKKMIGKRVMAKDSIEEKEVKSLKTSNELGFTISDEEVMVRILLNHLK